MCREVQCKKCRKPSWAGCGAHVEQVLGHVPRAERCTCGAAEPKPAAGLGATIKKIFGGS